MAPGRLANLLSEGSCDNWLVAVQTPSLSNHYRTNETDVFMETSKRFSLWKEQAKCESMRHQKWPLREQWCFCDRVRAENVSLQHRLGAESPSCLVSRSQTACTWRKPSGYVRLVISCIGGRKICSTRGKGFKMLFYYWTISAVLLHCVTI